MDIAYPYNRSVESIDQVLNLPLVDIDFAKVMSPTLGDEIEHIGSRTRFKCLLHVGMVFWSKHMAVLAAYTESLQQSWFALAKERLLVAINKVIEGYRILTENMRLIFASLRDSYHL